MNNIQFFDPESPPDRFLSTVRFRSENPGARSAVYTGSKVPAATPPAKVSETLKDRETQKVAIGSPVPRKGDAALHLQTSTSTINHAESPHSSRIADGHDDSRDSGNHLPNHNGNDSDSHDSLHSLFSADVNLTDTESSLEENPTSLDEEPAEGGDLLSKRLRAGNSPDVPIVLNDDVLAIAASPSCSPHGEGPEREAHRGFDERIPISLSPPGQKDASSTNDHQGDGSVTANDQSLRSNNRRTSPHPDHTTIASKKGMATKVREPRGGHAVTSGRPGSSKNRKRTRKEGLVNVQDGARPTKRQNTRHKALHDKSVQRHKRSTLFVAAVSDTSDSEGEVTSAATLRSRGNGNGPRPSLSAPQPAHPRRKPRLYSSSDMSTDESSSEENTTAPRPNSTHDERGQTDPEEVVWEHGRLRGYKIVNGKPYVLVPWMPTWESPDEYSRKEVARVKRRFECRKKFR